MLLKMITVEIIRNAALKVTAECSERVAECSKTLLERQEILYRYSGRCMNALDDERVVWEFLQPRMKDLSRHLRGNSFKREAMKKPLQHSCGSIIL